MIRLTPMAHKEEKENRLRLITAIVLSPIAKNRRMKQRVIANLLIQIQCLELALRGMTAKKIGAAQPPCGMTGISAEATIRWLHRDLALYINL